MSPTTSQSHSNPWFGISMGLAGIIAGYGLTIASGGGLLQPTGQIAAPTAPAPSAPIAQQEPSYDSLLPFDPQVDYYKGNPQATIALIEYSDYECPFCQRHHPTMQQALDDYGDDVVWVFRHYPLSFHPHAKPTAEASECVGEIGGNDKFWEFTDLVFLEGSDVANHSSYITQIGLDADAVQSCVDSGKYSDKVAQQLAEGTTAGVRGTPGTFVFHTKTKETKYISGAQPLSNIKSAIDSML